MANRTNRVGQYIGDYHLLHRLGGGSFGDVYLGVHVRTQAQAAVKVLRMRLTRGDELKEFINEARTFRLRHPNIVQLLDFGIDNDDVPYLVMDYAANGTLRDKHPKGTQVPLSVILSYITQLASALQYAHDQQLIHRDVKPENMLLSAHNDVLLSDFGIASVAHSSHSLNTLEGIGGTLPYMSPEQILGRPRLASDQYALGIVVYEWLTGTRPFKGTAVELAMQHNMKPPPSLCEKVPNLSADVEQVVLTALAKEPKQRFDSVLAFAGALKQASEIRGTSLRVVSLRPAATPTEKSVEVEVPLATEYAFANKHRHPAVSQSVANSTDPSLVSSARKKRQVLSPAILRLVLGLIGSAVIIVSGSIGVSMMTAQIAARDAKTTMAAQTAAVYNRAVVHNGSMFGFDAQHTRNNPFERILSPGNVSGLKMAWTSNPTGNFITSSPTVVNGVVYIGSGDNKLYAYNADGCGSSSSCAPLWSSVPTGDHINSSPAVANGVVYIGSDDGKLYAYSAQGCGSGTTGCTPLWSSALIGGNITSSPVVTNGVVYVGSDDGRLYAYQAGGCGRDKGSCVPLWISDATGAAITSSPAVANGVVYAGSYDDKLYAYQAEGCGIGKPTCPPLWSSDSTGSYIRSSPAVANGVVYISSTTHRLYAYPARGCSSSICAPLWISSLTEGYIISSPAVADGVVYVSSEDDRLYAYNAGGCGSGKSDCAPLWVSLLTGNVLDSSPMVANGVVYVGSDDHRLYAYKAQGCGRGKSDCAPLWISDPTGSNITSSPAVANGVVYVGSYDDKLYAFHL